MIAKYNDGSYKNDWCLQVYAIALYVEPAKAARELKLRDRGDFFVDADPDVFCDAILDGAFDKILQVQRFIQLNNGLFTWSRV